MKGKFVWILGIFEIIIGFVLFFSAQMEISNNSWYTWCKPYSSHEMQVIMMKWIGIILLISGVVWICLKLYQTRYTNIHTQDITQMTKKGGVIKCSNCGLTLSADVENCPRCGNIIKANNDTTEKNITYFCSKCGNKVNANETFCSRCGQKISK